MIKNIVKTLKNVFGGKKKSVVTTQETIKDNKPAQKKKKSEITKSGDRPHQKHRKKETPEEYRARHKKLAEERRAKREADKKEGKSVSKRKPLKQTESEPKVEEVVKPKIIADTWDPAEFKVDIIDGKTRFHDFELSKEIMHSIFDLGFKYCTEVQAGTLPKALLGEDVTAQAQTGTGKTAAFLITILNHIHKNPIDKKRKPGTPRALILAPTRELVLQIEKDAIGLSKYSDCNILSLLGGIDYNKQQNILRKSEIDILICTPGRLIDFMKKRIVDLQRVEVLVIDEADRMLDMGFIPDVKRIVLSTPQKAKRQTMFFTATMSDDVSRLSKSWTKEAFDLTIEPDELTQKNVEQITYITTIDEKPTLLYNIIRQKKLERVLIFANRRDESKKLRDTLESYGISSALLTGQVEQTQRIKRLERFRDGKVRVLVATDVASRGIHVEGISHVINYNMPEDPEEYVHRIGRTGRAGALGISISFADEEDGYALSSLEEYLGKKVDCTFPDEELLLPIPEDQIKPIKKRSFQKVASKRKPYNSNEKKGPRNRSQSKPKREGS